MTDLHCHILPRMDDGASDLTQALKMLRLMYRDGVRQIIATPHFDPKQDDLAFFVHKRAERMAELQHAREHGERPLPTVQAGAEIMANPTLGQLEGLEQLTMGDTRFLLVELPVEDARLAVWAPAMLMELQQRGFSPILAHAERYPALFDRDWSLAALVKQGVSIQINLNTLIHASLRTRLRLRRLFRRGLLHFVGTDAHDLKERAPHAAQGVEALKRIAGKKTAHRLLHEQRVYFDQNSRPL